MNSFMNSTFDVVDYIVNDDLEKLAEIVENLSDDAKTAYVPSLEEAQAADEKSFGVVLWHPSIGKFNKFAMDNKGITELNLALLAENADNLPEEILKVAATNLTCSAIKFGIEVPEKLKEYASDSYMHNIIDVSSINEASFHLKTATASSKIYALPEEKQYSISSTEEIKEASLYFNTHHNSFTPTKKLEYAINVAQAAKDNGIDLRDTLIEKYASLDTNAFNPDFKHHIGSRISFLKDNQDGEQVYKDLLEKSAELGPDKTAAALYIIDKRTGVALSYGKGIDDAIMATMDMQKEAGYDIDGTYVTKDQLVKLSNEDLTSIVGNNVISELKGDDGLDVLASLPKPIREEVINLIP